MPADTLRIGTVIFELDDMPEEIPLGGSQQMQLIKYPGGMREIQMFGVQDDTITWDGTLNYTNAVQKMEKLDAMFKSGNAYEFQIGTLKPRYAVISSFKPTYRSPFEIPYSISLEIAPKASLLVPKGAGSSTTGTTAPKSNAPAPQKTYIVKRGDSLWKIAARELNDGSRIREIIALNPSIKNPNLIDVGQKLVLPS